MPDFFLEDEDEEAIQKLVKEKGHKVTGQSAAKGISGTMQAIQGIMNEELVKSINGVFQFNLSGIERVFVISD